MSVCGIFRSKWSSARSPRAVSPPSRVTLCPCFRLAPSSLRKWSNLYDIQVTEGYRDPVIVTEFMHRFYVQEGNKRVSVLKFLDAPTVSAKVTRLYPGTWDSVESLLYGEFCAFWRVCPIRDRVLA